MTLADVLDRLEGVRRSGAGWKARCPGHEDEHQSLSVSEGREHPIVLTCHAGCDRSAILQAIGITDRDLMAEKSTENGKPRLGSIVATYDYTDAEGQLLFQVVRYEDKQFRQRRPNANGGWSWSLAGVPRTLYRLPRVREAVTRKEPVFVVEGEKDVHTLEGWQLTATTNAGGAEKWEPAFALPLRGAHVVILPDNDAAGRRHAQNVAASLYGRAATVRIVELPGLPEKGDISDWAAAGGTWDELQRLIRACARYAPEENHQLPTIELTNRPLREVTEDAVKALQSANEPPALFVRVGLLTRTRSDEQGRPLIEEVSSAALRGMLTRSADFVRVTKEFQRHVSPPEDVVADTLALGRWPFPALEGIVEAPTLRPDGTILDRPGYDAATRLVFAPPENLAPAGIPERPENGAVERARALIEEVIAEFPFADDASQANALALMLTPIIRGAVQGPVPLAVIDAPQQGSGKSLLAEVACCIATGRDAAMLAAPRSEEEWSKVLTGALSEGAGVICFDNVDHKLMEASLALALTARVWKGRVLGASRTVEIPVRCTWIATGNNIRLGGDIPRRSYWIRIDARSSRPWQRTGFRHPDLKGYVLTRRQALVRALLTMARAWWAAECPAGEAPHLGSYEEWARISAGILTHAGVTGFLGNIEEFYDQADDSDAQWEAFLAAWHAVFAEDPQTVANVVYGLQEHAELKEALPDELAGEYGGDMGSFRKRLGRALGRQTEVRHGEEGWRIVRAEMDRHNKQQQWMVKRDKEQ